jgi:DNA invertase Pin-like site-specific DNA recombinase
MLLIERVSRLYNYIMLIGYARVSTDDQDFALQEDALKKAGCKKVFYDKMSGAGSERKGLREALDYLRDGEDTLVVWRLDRLGRSLKNLIELMNLLEERGIGFKSLQESIDTTTSGGKLIFHIFGALAEFERNLIRERTMAGLAAARARGKKGGRRKVLDEEKTQRLYKLYDETNADGSRKYAIDEICEMMGISKSSLYRYLGQRGVAV